MLKRIVIATLCFFVAGLIVGKKFDNVRASDSQFELSTTTFETSPEASKSLCDSSEQVVFTCTTKKSAKLMSICTSKHVDAKTGYVQYRFGVPGKVELEFPTDKTNSQSAFSYTRYTRPLVTLLTLQFESNGYKYALHQDSNAEEKPPVNNSYLNITAPDANAKETDVTCREPVKGSLMLLEDVVPRSEE